MEDKVFYKRCIEDGVYDISGIEYLEIGDRFDDEDMDEAIEDFCEKYPNFVTSVATDVDYGFLLAETPTKTITYLGGSYIAGLAMIIGNTLIYARND